MLVGIVQGMERIQERISGFVRFEGSDGMVNVGTQLCLFSKGGLKFFPVASEWKTHASRRSVSFQSNGAEHLIERATEIMQNRVNGYIEGGGNFGDSIAPDFDTISIDVTDRFLEARRVRQRSSSRFIPGEFNRCEDVQFGGDLEKPVNLDLEIVDFGFGPFDLGETFQKRRFRFHDIGSVMTKNDELQQTKALMGALVRMKPKPHEEMKVGPKKKRAKSVSKKHAAVSKPKTA